MLTLISQRGVKQGYHFKDALEQNYVDYLSKFGLLLIPMPNFSNLVSEYFRQLSIERVILSGGEDVYPSNYHPEVLSETISGKEYYPQRDQTEALMLELALKQNIPVLGICRGMQIINAYFGGKISQLDGIENVKSHVNIEHPISLEGVSDITNQKMAMVNSYHGCGVLSKDLAPTLSVFAQGLDGVIEGVYHPNFPVAGLQWHPERESLDLSFNEAIINKFKEGKLFWRRK